MSRGMKARSIMGAGRAAEFRHGGFWTLFEDRHPEERACRAKYGPWFWQRGIPAFEMVITMYVAPGRDLVGVFFGQNERLGAVQVDQRMRPHRDALDARLKLRPEQRYNGPDFGTIWRVNCFAEDNWPAMSDWMVTEATRVERAVAEVLGAADFD